MVTISNAEPDEKKEPITLMLSAKQIFELREEMTQYNHSFDYEKPFFRIEDYIVFLLEILEREV